MLQANEHRLDRHRPDGLRDGGAAREEPAPTSPCGIARAARRNRSQQHGAKIAAQRRRSGGVRHRVRHGVDVGRREGGRRRAARTAVGRRRRRSSSSNARRSRSRARRELRALLAARGVELLAAPVSGNAKVIKAGRLSFVCSGPRARVRPRAAVSQDDRAGRIVRRRRRAGAHRQDLPQRVPRRRDAVAGRDHRARAEGRRAAPRVSRLHEPERDGLDVLALQDAGASSISTSR